MIQYHKSAFGLLLLLRVSGSAVYRSTIPGLLSVIIVIILRYAVPRDSKFNDNLQHPYAIGVLVASLTFLLVFRVQQGYARYWEACGAVHHMMSKWMDAVVHTAAYHMQCKHYNHIKPPSFFDYHVLDKEMLTRNREGYVYEEDETEHDEHLRLHQRAKTKSIETVKRSIIKSKSKIPIPKNGLRGIAPSMSARFSSRDTGSETNEPTPLEGPGRFDGNWGKLFDDKKATFFDPNNPNRVDITGFASHQGGHTPPLFLQELAHLTSLMTGVALSTLRNDIEGAESPLDIYEPGSPWPAVDPDTDDNTKNADGSKGGLVYTFKQKLYNFIGVGRSPLERTQYNAARPLPVLGGVSEGEIRFLQMARGPSAKTQLCWYWLSEFIVREHLAGSLGNVGPPIISRIIQFLGDGMIYYNHARKIMFIPFPFPHAQLSVFYVIASIPIVAILMNQYSDELYISCILAFLVVTCLSGIAEVARELENPFRNIPNELPLVTLQAQFNECLITMYAGYHPDHFWKSAADDFKARAAAETTNVDEEETRKEEEVRQQEKKKEAPVPNSKKDNDSNNNSNNINILLEQLKQQNQALQKQMGEMSLRQEQELDMQRKEIANLRLQLLDSDEKKIDVFTNS